ncbi:MAG: threonylcarbamoyl-AMP synthase [Desulfobulbaceae bacterium]|nr:threonylcarbamoyl-AMP synthase [Desulfobulbaceae bacterium]
MEPVTEQALSRAVEVLRSGGIVAFPTETYYGLAVDPFNTEALEHLFLLKARPVVKPVLALVREQAQISQLAAHIPALYSWLMQRFWPGAVTLIFPARSSLPWQLTAHTQGIGLRQSSHPVAARLLAAFGGPLTATSANSSGREPAINAQQAASLFPGSTDNRGFVLDGGETPGGAGSTVVALRDGALTCLRDGKIPFADVQRAAEVFLSSGRVLHRVR